MKLGLMSAALPQLSFADLVAWLSQNGFGMINTVIGQCVGYLLLVNVAAGQQKLFLFMLFEHIDQVVDGRFAVKDLALAVHHIFLKIKSGGFRNTEILELIQIGDTHFITDPEEMICCMPAGQYHG